MTVNKNRLSDDKYPMLMDKKTVAEYLGVSKSSVDVFLLNENLSAAAFEPSKLKRNFLSKQKLINGWRNCNGSSSKFRAISVLSNFSSSGWINRLFDEKG